MLAAAAKRYEIPFAFLAKLIWQESRFHADAVSPAGAQGIAQFMPATAAQRTLPDPFIATDAIFASAGFLRELSDNFHSFGLAAAAYNAGPGRVSRWLAGSAVLPAETIGYVRVVTGADPEEWRNGKVSSLPEEPDFSCERLGDHAAPIPAGSPPAAAQGTAKAWAVILIGNPRRQQLLAEYQLIKGRFPKVLSGYQPTLVFRRITGLREARFLMQIEQEDRSGADQLCGRLLRAGGSCFVLRNDNTRRDAPKPDQTATAVGAK